MWHGTRSVTRLAVLAWRAAGRTGQVGRLVRLPGRDGAWGRPPTYKREPAHHSRAETSLKKRPDTLKMAPTTVDVHQNTGAHREVRVLDQPVCPPSATQ